MLVQAFADIDGEVRSSPAGVAWLLTSYLVADAATDEARPRHRRSALASTFRLAHARRAAGRRRVGRLHGLARPHRPDRLRQPAAARRPRLRTGGTVLAESEPACEAPCRSRGRARSGEDRVRSGSGPGVRPAGDRPALPRLPHAPRESRDRPRSVAPLRRAPVACQLRLTLSIPERHPVHPGEARPSATPACSGPGPRAQAGRAPLAGCAVLRGHRAAALGRRQAVSRPRLT